MTGTSTSVIWREKISTKYERGARDGRNEERQE